MNSLPTVPHSTEHQTVGKSTKWHECGRKRSYRIQRNYQNLYWRNYEQPRKLLVTVDRVLIFEPYAFRTQTQELSLVPSFLVEVTSNAHNKNNKKKHVSRSVGAERHGIKQRVT